MLTFRLSFGTLFRGGLTIHLWKFIHSNRIVGWFQTYPVTRFCHISNISNNIITCTVFSIQSWIHCSVFWISLSPLVSSSWPQDQYFFLHKNKWFVNETFCFLTFSRQRESRSTWPGAHTRKSVFDTTGLRFLTGCLLLIDCHTSPTKANSSSQGLHYFAVFVYSCLDIGLDIGSSFP